MSTTNNVKRIIVGALLSGSAALARLGLRTGTAQAFDPQPDPPGLPASVAQRGLIRRRSRRGPCGLWTSGRSGHVIRWP